jgi:hypothetical protein
MVEVGQLLQPGSLLHEPDIKKRIATASISAFV